MNDRYSQFQAMLKAAELEADRAGILPLEGVLHEVDEIINAPEKRGICRHCEHPIGYHHLDDDRCSCKDCPCPGFEGYPASTSSG